MFLHNREELQALRQKAEAELHRQKIRVLICAGTGCIASGSKEIYEKMHNLAEINENVSVEFEGEVPGAAAKDCGNYLDMNLPMAKYLSKKYLTEVLENITDEQLNYPA